tara:strand:+ start:5026 stop:7542 length:2517 start_codon:yes stop_codon:yes gene_type:complete
MSRFCPPPDQINSINPKKSKKSFDENGQSIFSEIKKVIKDSFAADAFEQVGAMNAVVLEVREPDVMAMFWRNPLMWYQFMSKGQIPDYLEVRFRIPELHTHLPEPSGPDDWLAINLHPYAMMKKEKGQPTPGDIVVLDFQDKNNFRGAMVIETLNTNENPNSGGNCKSTDTAGSAAPPLNMASPSGDSQVSTPQHYSANNSPAPNSSTHGINYPIDSLTPAFGTSSGGAGGGGFATNPSFSTGTPDPVLETSELKKYKKNLYFVSIENIRTLTDFRNVDNAAETLLGKKVTAVCFSVAEGVTKIRDVSRVKKLIKKLRDANIDVGLSMQIDSLEQFHDNFVFMADIAKAEKVNFITYYLLNNADADHIARHDEVFYNFSNNMEIDYYAVATEYTTKTSISFMPKHCTRLFLQDNYYDYIRNNEESFYEQQFESISSTEWGWASGISAVAEALSNPSTNDVITATFPMYYMGGINFLSTPNDPCVSGERSPDILAENIKEYTDLPVFYTTNDKHVMMFTDYHLLTNQVSETIHSSTANQHDLDETQKQRFLSSETNTQTTNLTNVVDKVSSAVEDVIQEPTFNSQTTSTQSGGTAANAGSPTGDTQTAAAASPSAFASKPGMQCTPVQTGPEPGGPGGGGGSSATVEPPSFRFDSIENYQNLGWTANNSAVINNVIFDFMEKFSAAVYRRLPQNSPSFTGSNPKKIRLTSTARTYAKQAELMWDKIKNGGGDNAVYSLYGRKEWTTAVVNAYHANNFAAAEAAVKKRVEVDGGGSAHLSGKGVDVHTWSHINAEGLNSSGMTIAQMNNTKFVQAVVEAAKEVGARPVVEAYQQHVHITI